MTSKTFIVHSIEIEILLATPRLTLEFRFPVEETRYIRRVRKTKSSCTLTAPAGAREGRHEGQLCAPLGPPHLLPPLYPPHCFTPLLLLYLLTSDCCVLSIPLISLKSSSSPLSTPPPHPPSLFFWTLLVHQHHFSSSAPM